MLFNQNLSLAKIFSVVLTLSIVSITVQAQIRMSNRSNEYAERREEIVAKDSLHSFSSSITLSAKEESVNRKLTTLRKEMMHYYDSINFFPPAHSFYKSIAHIYSTPLFSILKQMPKGGILHLHPSAGVSYRWVIEQALQEPNCYVYWQPDNKDFLKGQLHFYKNETAPKGFYRIKSLQDSIPGFTNELYKLLTFDETIRKDSVDIWREFGKRFNRVGGFTSYQPVYEKLLVSMFDSLIADGVQHVELRSSLGSGLYDLEKPRGSFSPDSGILYIQRAIEKLRVKEPEFTVMLIYTNVRFQPVDVIRRDFVNAFQLRSRYPDIVRGYDLVAHEDKGNPTDYYRQVWLMRDSLANVHGVDMPLYFHDGESTWHHVQNLYDAVLLQTPRIGHGFNLSLFPAVEEEVRKQNICIEVCPLSNQILGYIMDLRMHPAHNWIRRGIQVTISPDDPGLFNYIGVTPDFWCIFLAWELNLRDLKKLCMNSITYSSLPTKQKQQALIVWEKKWAYFIDEIDRY